MIKPQDIIQFWFEEISPEKHFIKDPDFDQLLRDKFLELHAQIVERQKEDWLKTAEGTLAYILVLDQFSRNMFRHTPESFAFDDQALAVVTNGIAQGLDSQIPQTQRVFFYMPMMHSEDPKVHEVALSYFEAFPQNYKYELLHKKIIDQFGRYPHRNEILGRESTVEELEFLKQENSSF